MTLRLAFASVRLRLRSTLTLVMVVAILAVALITIQASVRYGADRALDVARFFSPADIVVRDTDIRPDTMRSIRAFHGVAGVDEALLLAANYGGSSGYVAGLEIPSHVFSLRESLVSGRLPTGPEEALAPKSLVDKLRLGLGDRLSLGVVVSYGPQTKAVDFAPTIVGIMQDSALAPRMPVVLLGALQNMSGSNANAALITLDDGLDLEVYTPEFSTFLKGLLPQARMHSSGSVYRETQRQKSASTGILQLYSLVLIVAAGFLMWTLATVQMSARGREMGVLLTLGVPPGTLVASAALEAVALTGLGSALGVAVTPLLGGFLQGQGVLTTFSPPDVLAVTALVVGASCVGWLTPIVRSLGWPVPKLLHSKR